MIFFKTFAQKFALLGIVFVLGFTSMNAQDGKSLFQQNCQSCHALDKNLTGPALRGFTARGPWAEKQNIYDWIHNPAAFMAKDQYTQA